MLPKILKTQAQTFRSQGKTFEEIRGLLNVNVPKSTLSGWCADVKLPKNYSSKVRALNTLNLKKARVKSVRVKQSRREAYFEELTSKNLGLVQFFEKNKVARKIALSILYLAEGSKSPRGALMFGNSDPNIVRLFMDLLRECYEVNETKFRITVQCRADQDTENLEKFWSKVTLIPLKQFYRTRVDRRTIGQKSRKVDYKGVCRIDYFSSYVDLELKHIAKMILKDLLS